MTYSEDNLDYRWRAVSEWGQPTAEACPWGLRDKGGNLWVVTELEECGGLMPQIEWQPLPPPVDDVMPPPEPDVPEKIAAYVETHPDFGSMTPKQAAAEAVRVILNDSAAWRGVFTARQVDAYGEELDVPPPEPEPKWVPCEGSGGDNFLVDITAGHAHNHGQLTREQAQAAAAILNAVDRGETVGRVRPWQEAPDDDTAVLRWSNGRWIWAMGGVVHSHRSPWMAQPAPPEEVER